METKKPLEKGTVIGLVLVGIGALLMLQTVGIFRFMWDITIAIGFLAGAVIFLAVFANDRKQWWALFPGFGMGFIGLMILLDNFFPRLDIGGPLFLGGLGAAFLAVYANRRDQIWPIIPGGVLLTLASVAAYDELFPRWDGGAAIFFLGLGLTFTMVYYLAANRQRHGWALIVAAVMFGIACLTMIGSLASNILFPLVLIGLGVFMLRDRIFTSGNR
ncbi:MAG TPA: hypothetical protein VD902_04475 [Symbiobacteriaceae bacterium]|nr:hypothetical protein [Symbiobacteriaceae bacterium]